MKPADPLTAALNLGSQIIDRVWEDPTQREQGRLRLLELAQQGELAKFSGQVQVVSTEAASSHWLAANWRPILMLTFGGLIVARWMGWAAPDLTEAEYIKLWDIVELGIGGYVIGRSAEKIIPTIAAAMGKGRE